MKKRTVSLLLIGVSLVFAGCQTAPTPKTRPKATRQAPPPPPLPPLPPGFKPPKAAPLPKTKRPVEVALAAAFTPASVSSGPNIYIQGYHVIPADPPFPAYTNAFIAADQLSNNVLSIRMTNDLPTSDPATWFEPARFDCYPMDNLVMVSISISDPDNHHFRSINTPCPAAFAPASAETKTVTTNTTVVRGKRYRLIKLQRAGEDIRRAQRYQLAPLAEPLIPASPAPRTPGRGGGGRK